MQDDLTLDADSNWPEAFDKIVKWITSLEECQRCFALLEPERLEEHLRWHRSSSLGVDFGSMFS